MKIKKSNTYNSRSRLFFSKRSSKLASTVAVIGVEFGVDDAWPLDNLVWDKAVVIESAVSGSIGVFCWLKRLLVRAFSVLILGVFLKETKNQINYYILNPDV